MHYLTRIILQTQKKRKKKKKTGNVFQRDSPNAKKNLRSFLLNFTDEKVSISKLRSNKSRTGNHGHHSSLRSSCSLSRV